MHWFRTRELSEGLQWMPLFLGAGNTHSTLLGFHLLLQMHGTSVQRVRSLLCGSGLTSSVASARLHGKLAVLTP